MRFPRMTTRRWMVVVALAGIGLAIGLYLHRSRRSSFLAQAKNFRQRSEASERAARNCEAELVVLEVEQRLPPRRPQPDGERKFIMDGDKMYFEYVLTPGWRERRETAAREAERARLEGIARLQGALQQAKAAAAQYDLMSLKYERAARYPWRPVEPDPPEPK